MMHKRHHYMIRQMKDTPITLELHEAFAEVHMCFIDEGGEWYKVTLDIEATVNLMRIAMDEKEVADALERELPSTARTLKLVGRGIEGIWKKARGK
jgi:hypothetical protein